MNLFLRLIALLIRNRFFKGPVGYLEPTRLKYRVWITDQDAFQHMNNGRYLSITDLSVIDHLMRSGILGHVRRAGMMPVVVYKDIAIYKMLRFPQKYEVETHLLGWTGPYACYRHRFLQDGRLCAESRAIGRIVGGKKGERPTMEGLKARFGLDDVPESPPLPEPYLQAIERLETERARRNATHADVAQSESISS